jgi:hypothetical protein
MGHGDMFHGDPVDVSEMTRSMALLLENPLVETTSSTYLYR